uniref:DnaJ domain-containing protein n=1 Tax=Toxoplasma gondii COUG TaxID=1074873 RepID=A0A2G8XLF1_TOXGO|nr:DnaJ domain-containing protein [Toxoplasma gondii COUG]
MVHPNAPPSSGASLAALLRQFNLPASCRSVQELRSAYVRLAQQLHPDKNGGRGSREFGELHERYLTCLRLIQHENSRAPSHRGPAASPHCSSHFSSHRRGTSGRFDSGRGGAFRPADFSAFSGLSGNAWTYAEWTAKMRERLGHRHTPGFAAYARPHKETPDFAAYARPHKETRGGDGGVHQPRTLSREAGGVAALLGVGFFGVFVLWRESGEAKREMANANVQLFVRRHEEQVRRLKETEKEKSIFPRVEGEKPCEGEAKERREVAFGGAGEEKGTRRDREEARDLGLTVFLDGEKRTDQEVTRNRRALGEMLRVEEANRETDREHVDLTPCVSTLASSSPSPSESRESLAFSPSFSSCDSENLRPDCSDVLASDSVPPDGSSSRSSLSAPYSLCRWPAFPVASLSAETGAASEERRDSVGGCEEATPSSSSPEAYRAQDLLTKQYRRGTVKKRLRRRSLHETEKTTRARVDEKNDGSAPKQVRQRQGTGFAPYAVPPVDVTRGHRGPHRESRYIHGYGGATGAGFDDYLAECELQRESAKRKESQKTDENESANNAQASSMVAACESVGEAMEFCEFKQGGCLGHDSTSFKEEKTPRDKTSSGKSEQATAQAAADAIGAEFTRNIRTTMNVPNAHLRPHWQVQN